MTPATVLALLRLLKDSAENAEDWSWINDFIARLSADVTEQEEVRETNAFALANAGKPIDAIAKLEALIALSGPTPERLGLLGGRYKRLFAKAATPAERLVYLGKSIDAYERGMELDLNQYYCSSNLPRLYRRGSARATTSGRDPFQRSWSPPASERKSAASPTNGCGRPCSAQPSTPATATRPRNSRTRSPPRALRVGNSRAWSAISKPASNSCRTRTAATRLQAVLATLKQAVGG